MHENLQLACKQSQNFLIFICIVVNFPDLLTKVPFLRAKIVLTHSNSMENQSRPNECANLRNLAAENNFPCPAHREDFNECAWLKDYEKLLYY